MRTFALLPLVLSVLACNSEPRYQLVRLSDRAAYKIDTKTGEVWLIYEMDSYEVLDPPATEKKRKEEEAQRLAKEAEEKQAREAEELREALGTDMEPQGGLPDWVYQDDHPSGDRDE